MTETFTFEIESDLKNKMEVICHELGMSVATAFTMFARKFVREKNSRLNFRLIPINFSLKATLNILKKLLRKLIQELQNLKSIN